MKKFLLEMFSDTSHTNPKVVVGFIAFVAMIVYSVTDVVTGAIGKPMVIEPIIFNGLMYTVFGTLGIAGAEAIFGNKNIKKDDSTEESTN